MPKIFISYRRDDSEFESHFICRALRTKFDAESIFMDVDTIPPGVDFRTHLNNAVSQCDVLLAVIGNQWLNVRSEDGHRRLDSPRDFVRIEIEAALSRDILIVPVLMGRVLMPNERDLPLTIAELAYRNAVEVRSGRAPGLPGRELAPLGRVLPVFVPRQPRPVVSVREHWLPCRP